MLGFDPERGIRVSRTSARCTLTRWSHPRARDAPPPATFTNRLSGPRDPSCRGIPPPTAPPGKSHACGDGQQRSDPGRDLSRGRSPDPPCRTRHQGSDARRPRNPRLRQSGRLARRGRRKSLCTGGTRRHSIRIVAGPPRTFPIPTLVLLDPDRSAPVELARRAVRCPSDRRAAGRHAGSRVSRTNPSRAFASRIGRCRTSSGACDGSTQPATHPAGPRPRHRELPPRCPPFARPRTTSSPRSSRRA